ncbi:hypothetical protein [Rugosimonospora africana]|uniref:DUF2637 domain-containing protein n=1 Tax=Rugosimonospora africana TaxID=556532 RepID=A0A8J3QPR9_9ACTN|nr:hypothetical protein [Rugosimonospora africana]GIH14699.1 hypothetical protein Raf01_28710 [Rugosimonospora africana]
MKKPTTGEPRLASVVSWAVLAASFGLSASTWIALAVMAGFTTTLHIGIRDLALTAHLAWLLPVAVDGYVVTALVLWMAPVPATVAEFAKKNTYAAAGLGVVVQSLYHALHIGSQPHSHLWQAVLAAVVGAFPPAVAGLAVHMRALIRRESQHTAPAHTSGTPALVDTAEGDSASTNTSWQTSTHSDPIPVTPVPVNPAEPIAVPAHLLPTARFVVTNYESSTGQTITPEELSVRMSIDQDTAARILATVDPTRHTPATRVNGTHPHVAAIGGAQ